MARNLVIVESPAKAKTIEKFLGKDFQVESSYGHIADLPSNELGIAVDGDFSPKYIVSEDKKAIVTKLKSLVKKAEMVWLASDEDREGEAIAWHLQQQLKLQGDKTKRIVFNEITKNAILKAVDNPRDINYNMVNAQQARRVLDRLVGYELSPILWRKIKGGLSAGRVQSVAVRLIVEKERQILSFNPIASFKVMAVFSSQGNAFKATLGSQFKSEAEAMSFLQAVKGEIFKVVDLVKKPAKKTPSAPFTTSTLQQEASRKLNFSVSKTMQVAQRLYESGLITYMRTDSVNLSEEATTGALLAIADEYGVHYQQKRKYQNKSKGAQEAHEAVRPTDFKRKSAGNDYDQSRLYELIWKRTVASQMADAKIERTQVKIGHGKTKDLFQASGEMIQFDGFLKVYLEGVDNEDEEQTGMLPKIEKGQDLDCKEITATERFSKPPYRFSEASLVKKLEELGIGRPSTYAPTITTVIKRGYVEKGQMEGVERQYRQLVLKSNTIEAFTKTETTGSDRGKLVPTDIGGIVNDFLVQYFPRIVDFGFTAQVEEDFDSIAEGVQEWTHSISDFYKDFHPVVKDVFENAERESGERILGEHPESGKVVLVRLGKFGAMAQIGGRDDEEKQFASLRKDQNLTTITLEEALDLFLLPKNLGLYKEEEVVVSNGRFGPYVKYGSMYVSLEKGENPMEVDLERAVVLIDAKIKADAPIAFYEDLPVQKGTGRFGPYIKWNSLFINVNKKYDFENLTESDIQTLIEEKKQKEIDKVIHNWEEEGIRVEKARWGRSNIIKGKLKIELPKTVDAKALSLIEVQAIIEKNAPKKKKKAPAKKAVARKKKK